MDSKDLDNWRIFFKTAGTSIFDVINNAIMVAAKDNPLILKHKRDQIAHLLYNHCCPCNPLEQSKNAILKSISHSKKLINSLEQDKSYAIESKGETEIPNPTRGLDGKTEEMKAVDDLQEGLNKKSAEGSHSFGAEKPKINQLGGSIYKQAVFSNDMIGGGDEIVEEVSRIKDVLDDGQNQSNMMLLELLMKLQKMDVNMEILEATLIGKSVSGLQKHGMKEIRTIARSLIRGWRKKVDEWMHIKAAATEVCSPARDKLPSRPFNEGLNATPYSSDELLQMFEGVDQTEFFSILPSEIIDGSYYTPEENSSRDGISRSVRRNHNGQENNHPQNDKNKLVAQDKGKRLREEDFGMKTSQSEMLQKAEKNSRKLREEYQHAQHAKKRRPVQLVDVNNHHPSPIMK